MATLLAVRTADDMPGPVQERGCPFMARPLTADDITEEEFDSTDNKPHHVYAQYDKLRKSCPVAHTSALGGYWLLTRYEDVKYAASRSDTFISSVKAVVPSDPRGLRRPPLNFDAPASSLSLVE